MLIWLILTKNHCTNPFLSLSRNEFLAASPNVKNHTRTESIGCKVSSGSPSKQQSGSLPGKDIQSNIYRRSSDSDLSITPKGELKN